MGERGEVPHNEISVRVMSVFIEEPKAGVMDFQASPQQI